MTKTKIILSIIFTIIGLTALTFAIYWGINNGEKVKDSLSGTNLYTQEDLNNAYNDGYAQAGTDKKSYEQSIIYYKNQLDNYTNGETEIVTNLRAQIAELNQKLQNTITINTQYQEQIVGLTIQKNQLQHQIENLQDELITNTNYDLTINSLNSQINNLNSQILSLNSQLIANNTTIDNLRTRISDMQQTIDYYEQYIASLNDENLITATFEVDNTVYQIKSVNKNETTTIENPTFDSSKPYIFNYWTVNGAQVDLNNYILTSNTTFVANLTYRYNVIFMVENSQYDTQIVNKNSAATEPMEPTKEGYAFEGWSLDQNNITDVSNIAIISNTTYYAVFTKLHTVTFMLNNEQYSTQEVKNGNTITPITLNLENKIFSGWYVNGSLVTDINSRKIYSNTTFIGEISDGILFSNNSLQEVLSLDENLNKSTITKIEFLDSPSTNYTLHSHLNSGLKVYTNNTDVQLVSSVPVYFDDDVSFSSFEVVTDLTFQNVNTSRLKSMRQMFNRCFKLRNINLSTFNTSNVTDMQELFNGCTSLTTLDLSSFDTSCVTNMNAMFLDCRILTDLNISNFNTSNVTDMTNMFRNCESLTILNLYHFNTINVTSMELMFSGCKALSTISLLNFNTSNVINMRCMFTDCQSLTTLDLSSFDTSCVTNMNRMFDNCSSLVNIYTSYHWNVDNVTNSTSMFDRCTLLPNFNKSITDKTKAHNESGGYLTLKNL